MIDRLHVEDVEFDKAYETKPRTDDTKIFREHVTTDKVTVSRGDITRTEKIDKPKYPKDVGRILIEEVREEKQDKAKPDVSMEEELKPRSTEVRVTRHEVEEVPRTDVKEDVIKIGKLDLTEMEKIPLESRRGEEIETTYTERVDGARKVVYKSSLNSRSR